MSPDPSRRSRPWWVAIVCGMASYIDAAAITTWGIALVIYQHAFGLDVADIGLLSGLLTLGIAVGSVIGGRLGDRLGRRSVFIATMVGIVIGALLMAASTNVWLMLAATLLVGVATGADLPVSLATIAEAAPDRTRGRMLGFSQLLWIAGAVVPGLASAAVGGLGRAGGQILFVHIGVAALLVLLARVTIPESQTWLTARDERQRGIETVRAERSSIRGLFRAPYLVPFVALLVFFGLMTTGGNIFGQYGTYILVNVAGVPVEQAGVLGLVALPASLGAALLFLKVVTGSHRFAWFTAGAIMVVVGAFVPVVFGLTVPTYIVSLLLFSVGGAFAGDSIMKVWTQQSFPTLLRATAQGAIIAVARFGAAAFAFVVPLLIQIGAGFTYAVIGALMGMGAIVAWAAFRTRDSHDEIAAEPLLPAETETISAEESPAFRGAGTSPDGDHAAP